MGDSKMQRLGQGRLTWGVLASLAWFGMQQPSAAADKERVKFDTWDQVEIHGTFYPGSKGNKSPCALLLHPIGANSQMQGWDELASSLQKEGFAVLTFDFRGHGDSTNVGQLFWRDRDNQQLKSFRPGKLKEQISYKDFATFSYGSLVNDIAAAKRFLDKKNDSSECNSANVVVIGAESGATLGAMWIWHEWHRRRVSAVLPMVTQSPNQTEGQDICCAVWLSINPELTKGYRVSADSWLRTPVREKVPMFFLYGERDTKAASYSKHLFEGVLRAHTDKQLKHTIMRPIKDTALSGRELLGKQSLDTEKLIVTYVNKVLEARGANTWSRRDVDKTLLVRIPYQNYLR
jgi:alpha-beta hydrolase superfamily lysophospholipase